MRLPRRVFPVVALTVLLGAIAYAVSFQTLSPADFTFNNEDEVRTLDPAMASGHPENRLLNCLFEGLLRLMPVSNVELDADRIVPLEAAPGSAEQYELSADSKTYTFHLRPDAKWSNGDPVTAYDFVWSWRRTLHPDTASEYCYQMYFVVGAKQYNHSQVEIGDRVEVELTDRPDASQAFPRGTVQHGIVRAIDKGEEPTIAAGVSKKDRDKKLSHWQMTWKFDVEIKPQRGASTAPYGLGDMTDWDAAGIRQLYSRDLNATGTGLTKCHQVLLDFDAGVGARALDARTLVVTLNEPTPYFAELTSFYPLFPVHPPTVERYGAPNWTRPGNLVGNGPFTLEFRRLRDRIRMRKNDQFWDRDNVQFRVVDAMPIKSETTALNMFLKGQLDWSTKPPNSVIPQLKQRNEYVCAPASITYFYRLNVARKPLDDVRVRRALNAAIDKREICEYVTKAGQLPARCIVPPGMPGYRSPLCGDYDPAEAKRLLAEAGYPGGAGFPKMEIFYNTNEGHRDIAEVIQQHWRELGIDIA